MKFHLIRSLEDLEKTKIPCVSTQTKVALKRAAFNFDRCKENPCYFQDYVMDFTNLKEFLIKDGLKPVCNQRLGQVGVVVDGVVYKGSLRTIVSLLGI